MKHEQINELTLQSVSVILRIMKIEEKDTDLITK